MSVAGGAWAPRGPSALTTREKQVLALLRLGMGPKRIAQRLGITRATVCAHLAWSRRKLGLGRLCHIPRDVEIPAAIAADVAPRRFCPRCGLSEPHECIDVRYLATSRRGSD